MAKREGKIVPFPGPKPEPEAKPAEAAAEPKAAPVTVPVDENPVVVRTLIELKKDGSLNVSTDPPIDAYSVLKLCVRVVRTLGG